MKTVMNKLITTKSIAILVLVLLAVLGPSFVKVAAQDPEPGPAVLADDVVTSIVAGKLRATISFHSVEDDIAAIEDVLNQYAVAVNTGDFELWLFIHADDVVKMGPDAPAIFGREALRADKEAAWDNFTLEMALYPEEAQVDGDMGFARGTYTLSITPKAGGETIDIMKDGKYLTLCKRQADGSWKISHDCYNSNLPPAQ
ncbi:MAG: YybH family protein [Planctomycetota bacterium]|jgi:uncharacterized protein (TIGR02246 family)